jgi:uncharacterized protein
MRKPKIDVHIHLAGTGCCNSGCWISQSFRRRYTFLILKAMLKIRDEDLKTTADVDWQRKVSDLVAGSVVDYGVVLGFDGVYDPATNDIDLSRSQMIIPHDWVFATCKKYTNLLPGPSINPFKKNALQELDECIQKGAVLIKWLPATQSIDVGSPDLKEFYRKMAAAKIPLLVHMGGERTFKEVSPEFNNVLSMQVPLSMGVKVIAAHSATRIIGSKEKDQQSDLIQLMKEYPHLYVDNSGMCNPGRFAHVHKIPKNPLIESRTLYGSDWPVPSNAFYYLLKLGWREVSRLEKIPNLISRDFEIKSRFGYSAETLTRAADVLCNLDRWVK